jgi:hypothetical protein
MAPFESAPQSIRSSRYDHSSKNGRGCVVQVSRRCAPMIWLPPTVDYIPKPLAGAEILARVRTHLRLRAAYESLVELQVERIQRLAASQQSLMPQADDLPDDQQRASSGDPFRHVFCFYLRPLEPGHP